MTNIVVTGSTGLLGATLVPWLIRCGHVVARHGFQASAEFRADLRLYEPTASMLDRSKPQCIIHLAALTDVDAAQLRPHDAYTLNVASVAHLCRWIRENAPDCHLVQISTDQVYDGCGPHREAGVTVSNIYAFSKIAGESIAAGVCSTVLRTNFFGRSRCPSRMSFSDWIYRSIQHREPITLFEDVRFSPLSLTTLSDMIERVVQRRPRGVFNVGGADGMSKADFAYAFAQALDLPTTQLRRAQSDGAAPRAAYRPKDMRMDSTLFEQTMGLRLPAVTNEILATRDDYLEPA